MSTDLSVNPYSYQTDNNTYSTNTANNYYPELIEETPVDEEKSSSMAKMVGLTALGAISGALIVGAIKKGKISNLEKDLAATKEKVEEAAKNIEKEVQENKKLKQLLADANAELAKSKATEPKELVTNVGKKAVGFFTKIKNWFKHFGEKKSA
jgi:cell division protein FtsB